jgi:UDP-N-acetylmuramate dehydrogenase
MPWFDDWKDIVTQQAPLAPLTYLRIGGPAQALAAPRGVDELTALIRRAAQEKLPVRILGAGCNLLVRDEGVPGLVVRLADPAFAKVEFKKNVLTAYAGCSLTSAISEAARRSLSGLETLIGIPGSIGGALKCAAGSRAGAITDCLAAVNCLTLDGQPQRLEKDDLSAELLGGSLEPYLILSADFALEVDDPDNILKRMRKFWIQKKARQPLSFQAAGRLFRAPKGLPIEHYLEEAGVQDAAVGGAALSERNPNYVVVREGATARDVLRLIEMVKASVYDRLGQSLQLALTIW